MHHSTISRELKRNSDKKGNYRPDEAQLKSSQHKSQAHAAKAFKQFRPKVTSDIKSCLKLGHSPEQISGANGLLN